MSEVERAVLYFFAGFLVMWFLLGREESIEKEVEKEIEEGVGEEVKGVYWLYVLGVGKKKVESVYTLGNRYVVHTKDGIYEGKGVVVDDAVIFGGNIEYVGKKHVIVGGEPEESIFFEIGRVKVEKKKYDMLLSQMRKIVRLEKGDEKEKKIEM
jgi:hypothetical protein